MTSGLSRSMDERTGDQRFGYSASEIAEQWGVSTTFVRAAIGRGELKAYRVGKRLVILREDVDAWIKRNPPSAA